AIWLKTREFLGTRFPRVRLVRGRAYADSSAVPGEHYVYELRPVVRGREALTGPVVEVRAGALAQLRPPTGVTTEAGDQQVLVVWEELDGAVAYRIERAIRSSGPFAAISPSSAIVGLVALNPLTFDSIKPARPGFLDTTPKNDTTYYYRIVGIDLLNRPGQASAGVSAVPRDKTPPETPSGIVVRRLVYGLELAWPKVTKDIAGREERVKLYDVYRYPSYERAERDSVGDGVKAGTVNQVADTTTMVRFSEHYPKLQPDSVYWYRISCSDKAIPASNTSRKSAVVSGFFKDTVPPASPTQLRVDCYEDSIILIWTPPTAQDLAGFDVYRGICGGESVVVYRQFKVYRPYELFPIANIDSSQVVRYVDRSLPKGSPIFYRYALKAYDRNQNYSPMSESICARLRDRTGPLPPVIAGLKARDRALLVEWVAPPVQDLFGFVVERALDSAGPWLKISPELKLPDTSAIECESIPPVSRLSDTTWTLLDTQDIRAGTEYWYRVRGVDYLGNEGRNSVPISSFTYSRHLPPVPTSLSAADSAPGIVVLTWQPGFDSSQLGFVVFRSTRPDAGFHQVSPIISGNRFVDSRAVRGEKCYYQVQYLARDGSPGSAVLAHQVP
ncbi:MAG: hypothetical protein ABIK62_07425, partial [candidate division WOR-3 bacterium]